MGTKKFGHRTPRPKKASKGATITAGLFAVLAVVALIAVAILIGGLVVYAVFAVFNLDELVDITFWQACGIALLLGGVGASGNAR